MHSNHLKVSSKVNPLFRKPVMEETGYGSGLYISSESPSKGVEILYRNPLSCNMHRLMRKSALLTISEENPLKKKDSIFSFLIVIDLPLYGLIRTGLLRRYYLNCGPPIMSMS